MDELHTLHIHGNSGIGKDPLELQILFTCLGFLEFRAFHARLPEITRLKGMIPMENARTICYQDHSTSSGIANSSIYHFVFGILFK